MRTAKGAGLAREPMVEAQTGRRYLPSLRRKVPGARADDGSSCAHRARR